MKVECEICVKDLCMRMLFCQKRMGEHIISWRKPFDVVHAINPQVQKGSRVYHKKGKKTHGNFTDKNLYN